ncbi:unnamed protein product [Meloidogyne enterolobii]|uniref:Uncharacterized protein n=1 Tax=Meloidogyne enterolobii TaxID=390850 RepID=A0ACB1A3K5_MELEN
MVSLFFLVQFHSFYLWHIQMRTDKNTHTDRQNTSVFCSYPFVLVCCFVCPCLSVRVCPCFVCPSPSVFVCPSLSVFCLSESVRVCLSESVRVLSVRVRPCFVCPLLSINSFLYHFF